MHIIDNLKITKIPLFKAIAFRTYEMFSISKKNSVGKKVKYQDKELFIKGVFFFSEIFEMLITLITHLKTVHHLNVDNS